MKRSRFVILIEILLFLSLLAAASLLAVPAGAHIDRSLKEARDGILAGIRSSTGLSVGYSSMSPSVFRSIRVRDLVLEDSDGGAFLAILPDVEIVFDVRELAAGKGSSALKKIRVMGGSVTLDPSRNPDFLPRFRALFASDSTGTSLPDDFTLDIDSLSLSYATSAYTLSSFISEGEISIDESGLSLKANTSAGYQSALPRDGLIPARVSAEASVEGKFERTLTAGTASVALKALDSDLIAMDSLRFLASWRDSVLTLDSTQNLQPVDLTVQFNAKTSALTGTFSCDRLFPLRWVRFREPSALVRKLEGIESTGTGSFGYDQRGLTWNLALANRLPASFYGGGSLELTASSAAQVINLKSFGFTGSKGSLAGSLLIDPANLSLDGHVSAKALALLRGTPLTGECYFQPEIQGTRCVIPEAVLGSARFSGIEIVSQGIEGGLEISLSGYDGDGQFSAEGTLSLQDRMYLQLYGAFDSVSVSNVLATVSSFLSPGKETFLTDATKTFSSYRATTEAYFSTDFANLSFNCPRMVLASTERDGLFFLLSAEGTERRVSLSDLSLSFSGYTLNGSVQAEFPKGGDILIDSSLLVNSLPYRLTGMLSGQTLSLYGDYALAASLYFPRNGGIRGGISFENLPLPLGPALGSLSLQGSMEYRTPSDWNFRMEDGKLEELKGLLPLDTAVEWTGTADPNGIFMDRISLYDRYSRISGFGGFSRTFLASGDTLLEGQLELSAESSSESIRMDGSLTVGSDTFYALEGSMKDVPLERFLKNQGPSNLASGSFSLSGSRDTPFISLSLDSLLYRLGGFDLEARGNVLLDDATCSVTEASASWNGHVLTDLTASLDLGGYKAAAEAQYTTVVGRSSLSSRLSARIDSDVVVGQSGIRGIPSALESFNLEAVAHGFSWKNIRREQDYRVFLARSPGITELSTGEELGFSGFIVDSGEFSLSSPEGKPIAFDASGFVSKNNLSMDVTGIQVNAGFLWGLTGLSAASVDSGTLSGDLRVSGLLNDPEFSGVLRGNSVTVSVPSVSSVSFGPFDFTIQADKKDFLLPPVKIRAKKGGFSLEGRVGFERWIPASVSLKTSVLETEPVRIDAKNALFSASGYARWNIDAELADGRLSVIGDAAYERGSIAVFSRSSGQPAGASGGIMDNLNIDLSLSIGKKVEFRWPTDELPIINGLLQADEPLRLSLDTASHRFSLKGTANLKGGEIFYVKRSFYLRQGSIVFNENESIFDPLISFRAEIREQDDQGGPVRIILSSDKQPLSRFSPQLSADPPKSELEILSLLGQAAIGDTSRENIVRDTVITASDLFTQLSLFRQAENGVRDLLGLDLFSIRTLILQNAIFGPAMKTDAETPMTIGNYFDNTTVYMGKYLGSAMYADALLHFSYYDPKSDQNTGKEQSVFENMLIQPEFGLEVTTPFFLLRWGITPGLTEEALRTLFVADNSVTLSWKFSY